MQTVRTCVDGFSRLRRNFRHGFYVMVHGELMSTRAWGISIDRPNVGIRSRDGQYRPEVENNSVGGAGEIETTVVRFLQGRTGRQLGGRSEFSNQTDRLSTSLLRASELTATFRKRTFR